MRATPSTPSTAARRDAAARAARVEAVPMTRDALARLELELHELTQIRRPGVVARIKAAREHGDLKENAEYQAAREEQSFLEGRVRLLEDRKRHAVIVDDVVTGMVALGSVVVVEVDGDTMTYSIVGTTDADPAAGRISTSSPVGAALIGAVAGSDVEVRTPRGSALYRVLEVR
ncbi:MAG: transcription elongation factor GreA [Chloroflexi bacterium]|nr:transcription elongation factor GreA [Chloroflexota bacterium]